MHTNTSKRFVGEVVELSRDCELGQEGDRAVVTALELDGHYMTLTFADRVTYTGADYKYLRAYESTEGFPPRVKPGGCATMVGGSLGLLYCDLPGGHLPKAHRWNSSAGPVPVTDSPETGKPLERDAALRELRALVSTYLEGSDDAAHAADLLDALAAIDVPIDISDAEFDVGYVTNVGPASYDTFVTHRATGVSAYVKASSLGSPAQKLAEGFAILRKALAHPTTAVASVPAATRARTSAPQSPPTPAQENRERAMLGCTEAAIDTALGGKEPRDVAMYAMSCLSNAQELIQRKEYEGKVEWTVAHAHHANTIRQLINIAKYAIDKAVPR